MFLWLSNWNFVVVFLRYPKCTALSAGLQMRDFPLKAHIISAMGAYKETLWKFPVLGCSTFINTLHVLVARMTSEYAISIAKSCFDQRICS